MFRHGGFVHLPEVVGTFALSWRSYPSENCGGIIELVVIFGPHSQLADLLDLSLATASGGRMTGKRT